MDDTCTVLSDSDIEIIVFNGATISREQFSCLLPKGSSDNTLIYAPSQDGELLDSYAAPLISNDICNRNTPSPTLSPTPLPTDKPTQSPSDKPTESPGDRPSVSSSDRPTMSPTNKPSPRPTNLPTLDLTAIYCDFDFNQSINIVFSNGCNIPDDDACGDIISFSRNVVKRTYIPSQIDSLKYIHII